MMADVSLYQQEWLEEYRQPVHRGSLENESGNRSFREEIRNHSCGDSVTLCGVLSANGQSFQKLRWEGTGCVISQVSMERLINCVLNKELSLTEILGLTEQELLKLMGLSEIAPGRRRCLRLGLEGLQALAKRAEAMGSEAPTK